MTDELNRRMAKLREITPRLNAATDQASRLVAMAEKLLVDDSHIGVAAQVPFASSDAGTDEDNNILSTVRCLAFGRVAGCFRIHVAIETRVVDADGRWLYTANREDTLWPSCDRDTKLRAFEKLPELLDAIIREAESLAKAAEETAAKIKDLTEDKDAAPPAASRPASAIVQDGVMVSEVEEPVDEQGRNVTKAKKRIR